MSPAKLEMIKLASSDKDSPNPRPMTIPKGQETANIVATMHPFLIEMVF